ncbi:MAG: M20/M25/M40 family metallo-hydrolase [Chloroflexi bacterium]|nr:M20/M25/M40 family metallo-hydrolase [Chloroflexota bacterium]
MVSWLTAARHHVEEHLEGIVAETIVLAEIAAPTFAEGERAAYVHSRLGQLGFDPAWIDRVGNVRATRPGRRPGPGLLLAAHLDTVFPVSTPCAVRRDGGRLHGPAVGDNSVAVAATLWVLEALRAADAPGDLPLHLAFTVGEEGLGNLRGIAGFFAQSPPPIAWVVAIEGHDLGTIVTQAVGCERLRATYRGPGGHSWEHFGRPNAAVGLARAIVRLASLPLPGDPKTTLSVGTIAGGTGVNVIPAEAACEIDMRSVDPPQLAKLAAQVGRILESTAAEVGLTCAIESIGSRPAGSLRRDHLLVQVAERALRELGIEPRYGSASTDANLPLSRGLAAITLGVTRGANMHRLDEWIEIEPIARGVQQLLIVVHELVG